MDWLTSVEPLSSKGQMEVNRICACLKPLGRSRWANKGKGYDDRSFRSQFQPLECCLSMLPCLTQRHANGYDNAPPGELPLKPQIVLLSDLIVPADKATKAKSRGRLEHIAAQRYLNGLPAAVNHNEAIVSGRRTDNCRYDAPQEMAIFVLIFDSFRFTIHHEQQCSSRGVTG